MKLYLLRHGAAYDREDWQDKDDEQRPLTDDGTDAMKREARRLSQMKLKLDAIITSPLVRARETAWLVAKALDILLGQYVEFDRLMMVGHEPDFSQVIAQLIGGGTILMRKGGLARVDISELHPPHGELVWLLTPSVLDA